MARWVRWDVPVRAPLDDFLRLLSRGLTVRGVQVEGARHFDLAARGFGCRAYVVLEATGEGLSVVVKLKGGLFGSPLAMERVVREASGEAEARLKSGAKVEGAS